MAYDRSLAARVQDLLPTATTRPMFGGLAFLLPGGHMAVCVGDAELLVRTTAEDSPSLRELEGVSAMEMSGRASRTWVRVADHLLDGPGLEAWVRRGEDVAASLPAKA